MIANILNALFRFRAEATPETFECVFGKDHAPRLYQDYRLLCSRDLISFYSWLGPDARLLFEAHLAAQIPTLTPADPLCAECGGELYGETETARGVCADCREGN